MQKRQYQKTENSRRKLLQAARQLTEENGYAKTSVRSICTRAGLSIGAFYHHYPNKDALLNEAFVYFDDTLTPKKMEEYNALPPLAAAVAVLVDQTIFSEGMGVNIMREYYRALLQQNGKAATDRNRLYYQTVLNYVRSAAEGGMVCQNMRPEEIAELLIKNVRGNLVDWCLHDGSYPVAARTRQELELYLRLFGAKL